MGKNINIINKNVALQILNDYKQLLNAWEDRRIMSPEQKTTVRTRINKNKLIVQKILTKVGINKRVDIGPPPAVGGYLLKSVNPFDIIFDPPYGMPVISFITDIIDEAIGIIENTNKFLIEPDEIDSTLISQNNTGQSINKRNVFIVHGHDNELKETVARFLEKIRLNPIILHEQPNEGNTIIEKFERHSNVGFAVVLMSPDDLGNSKDKIDELNNRARQNVIFELGYFFGKLGRQNVCALIKGNIERPTDYDGIIYIGFDNSNGWKMLLAKELKNAGLDFDGNKIFE